jgi:hypothetical protein
MSTLTCRADERFVQFGLKNTDPAFHDGKHVVASYRGAFLVFRYADWYAVPKNLNAEYVAFMSRRGYDEKRLQDDDCSGLNTLYAWVEAHALPVADASPILLERLVCRAERFADLTYRAEG